MPVYRWTYEAVVSASDEDEAKEQVIQALKEALSDPDTILLRGKLEEIPK